MENREAIRYINAYIAVNKELDEKEKEAFSMAISALEKQEQVNTQSVNSTHTTYPNALESLNILESAKDENGCVPMSLVRLAFRNVMANDRWIPVAEKQPELTHFMYDVTPFSDTVLVTVRNQYGAERLVLGNYEQRKGWDLELLDSMDERFQWHAVAWRPLPEPYKAEEES